MTGRIGAQLKKGVLELRVLALLSHDDSYGFDIAGKLAEAIDMGEGTIYSLMRRLLGDGLVETYLKESDRGPPRKYIRITSKGHGRLVAQKSDWVFFADAANRIVGALK
ncbi:MAG: PadR family transcriptional regulator [Novosphingobium sp.]|nr:PadR family transcriptional regulator [Novosphingobium sp.]